MRILATLLFFALVTTTSAHSPEADPAPALEVYVSTFSSVDGLQVDSEKLLKLVHRLSEKQANGGSNVAFVQYLFSKTRHHFLRNYAEYATFSQTVNSGTYNCLTGTALYALLLEQLHIPYQILETNYHIFLLAQTENGRVLLEATDPQNGLVQGEASIDARIEEYRQGVPMKRDRTKTYYTYQSNLYNQVTLDELTGLLYYNRAVAAYNAQDLEAAVENLVRSTERYQSRRTDELGAVLQVTIAESGLSADLKKRYLRSIQRLRTLAADGLSARSH